jgi:hypothetical protein
MLGASTRVVDRSRHRYPNRLRQTHPIRLPMPATLTTPDGGGRMVETGFDYHFPSGVSISSVMLSPSWTPTQRPVTVWP